MNAARADESTAPKTLFVSTANDWYLRARVTSDLGDGSRVALRGAQGLRSAGFDEYEAGGLVRVLQRLAAVDGAQPDEDFYAADGGWATVFTCPDNPSNVRLEWCLMSVSFPGMDLVEFARSLAAALLAQRT